MPSLMISCLFNLANVPANLFLVSATCEVTNAYSCPSEFCHELRHTAVGARCAAALRHLKHVQEGLAADPFKAIELNLAPDALQGCEPGIGRPFGFQMF